MLIPSAVAERLAFYRGEPPGVLRALARLMMSGELAGTGKLLLFPVDQGFEHGPSVSFAKELAGMQPLVHARFAAEAGCSAHVAPLGALNVVAGELDALTPLVLKLNSAETLSPRPDRMSSWTASVADALRLGCTAVGLTLYTGSQASHGAYQEASEIIREARSVGLPTIIWAYPRGSGLKAEDEQALDVVAYAAHIACQLGAHIIKVKVPHDRIAQPAAARALASAGVAHSELKDRIAYVKAACFAGRRLVVCSGGPARDAQSLLEEVRNVALGGADGSIIGRNVFQRPRAEALALVKQLMALYRAAA